MIRLDERPLERPAWLVALMRAITTEPGGNDGISSVTSVASLASLGES